MVSVSELPEVQDIQKRYQVHLPCNVLWKINVDSDVCFDDVNIMKYITCNINGLLLNKN